MYFINSNIKELEEQCKDLLLYDLNKDQAPTITYQLKERACIVEILCSLYSDLIELGNLNRRINLIRNFIKLCFY